jgi:hypothetical protein
MKHLVASLVAAAAVTLSLPLAADAAPPGLGRQVADAAKSGEPLVTEVRHRRYYRRYYYRPYVYYRPVRRYYYRPRYYGYYPAYYYRPYRPRYYYGGYYYRPYGYYWRPRPVFGFSFGPVGFYSW